MSAIKTRLWRRAHKGQINVIDFQKAVRDVSVVFKALSELPNSASGQDQNAPRPPSPDPDEALAQLAQLSKRRKEDEEEVAAAETTNTQASQGRGIAYDVASSKNLRFKGDEFKVTDDARQLAAEENGDPVWYSSRGQIWRVVDGRAPEPMQDV